MKKILSVVILLLIIINAFYSSYAYELGTKRVELSDWCKEYFKYQGERERVPFVTYSKNGTNMPAFCISPNLSPIGPGGLDVTVNGKITNEAVWKVLTNSYPYKSLSELGVDSVEEAYYATQVAVYVILGARNQSDFEPRNTTGADNVYNAFLKILNNASTSKAIISNNDRISIAAENDWNIDGEFLSKTYKLNSVANSGTFKLEVSGSLPEGSKLVSEQGEEKTEFNLEEKFKILVPLDKIEEIYEFSLKATSTLRTCPILYGKSTTEGVQDYALVGEENETFTASLVDKTIKNTTKIKIIKKEYGTEKRLPGVKFNILDSNKNIKYENLISDDAGEIEVSKLLPGKYYIQEIETLEGYNKYSDLVEINITLNEEIEVIVNNTLKTINEVSKDKETIEIVENKTENKYKTNATETKLTSSNTKKLPITGY